MSDLGGGMYLSGQYSGLSIYDSTISNNYAASDGGGIFVYDMFDVVVDRVFGLFLI